MFRNSGAESVGQTVGNPSAGLTILSSNLPTLNFSGLAELETHAHGVTSNAAGSHNHQYQDIGTTNTNDSHTAFWVFSNPMSLGIIVTVPQQQILFLTIIPIVFLM